ncbi:GNAT family N-acetyltransferase [Tissierella sp. MSJ-40]|uniref:GNAT family N-acetyltransferase n=1 Tax=Tissierella simiarum TaxID=2841534 RepID=A0ABS6E9N1_9FIRM|nr:GNAT family N-acetyltransferase [Tissierella simiarum]MBU5439621.1 GNAT family N-acetyltransferase [Tissierella simiarum]
MYIELRKDEYGIVSNYFNFDFQTPALAVINGYFPGKVYVDNKENPKGIIVWAISRWAYAYFELENIEKNREFFKEFMEEEIIPIIDDLNEEYFEIYSLNDDYDRILKEEIQGFYLYDKHYENTFTLNEEKFRSFNFKYDKKEVLEEKFPIIPKKYEQYFKINEMNKEVDGIILLDEGEVVSQCINNGFENDNKYFIDVDTFDDEERNKGYATIVAYELIKNLLNKEKKPFWETREDNMPSICLAAKLGFEKIERYPVYIYKRIRKDSNVTR